MHDASFRLWASVRGIVTQGDANPGDNKVQSEHTAEICSYESMLVS